VPWSFCHALNAQRGGAVAGNLRAHLAQHDHQIGDFGLARGIFQHGFAVS
jgi:hypothetical protein